jgi:phage tail-like protein
MIADAGQLIVRRGGEIVATVFLNLPVLTIGRAPENALTLPDPLVSRHHAEVRLQSGGPMLTDLASANGTFLGETRLPAQLPHPLEDGTTFSVGPFTITYQAAPRPEPAEAAALPVGEAPLVEAELPVRAPVVQSVPVPALPVAPRPALPAPLAGGTASAYLRDLPAIFQDGDFLGRFLLVFESVWEPLEQRQDHTAMYYDPRTCPASFLPWLASWLDLALNAHWPEARRRRLLAEAMDLYRWRGTSYGLVRMIEVCTGVTPRITESPAEPFVFTVRIAAPPGATVERDLIEDLIREHKSAHAGYRLEVVP